MNPLQTVVVVLMACCLSSDVSAQQLERSSKPVIGICLIPEFGFIPEVDAWPRYEKGELPPKEIRQFEQAWEINWKDKLVPIITPQTVRRMVMPRDRKGIEPDTPVGIANDIKWTPVTMHELNEFRRYVVFRGTACHLPRISAIRRWLSVYCLYNANEGSISRVTFIVHGDRDE